MLVGLLVCAKQSATLLRAGDFSRPVFERRLLVRCDYELPTFVHLISVLKESVHTGKLTSLEIALQFVRTVVDFSRGEGLESLGVDGRYHGSIERIRFD